MAPPDPKAQAGLHLRAVFPIHCSPVVARACAAALPITAEMAALRLFQLLELFWLGRVSTAAVAAVGVALSLRWALLSLAMGLGVGGMSLVAQGIGELDYKAAGRAAWQAMALALWGGLVLSAAGLAAAAPLLRLLRASPEVYGPALTYLRISFLGLTPAVLVFTAGALWRGAGSARTAAVVLVTTMGVAALVEPFLVLGLGPCPALGIKGAALAGVLGPALGAVVHVAVLASKASPVPLRPPSLRDSLRLTAAVMARGAASGLQLLARALAGVALVALIARFGAEALAGYAVANHILMLVLIPSFYLGNAAAALVVKSLDAGEPFALRRVSLIGTGNIGYITAATVVLFALAPRAIAAFYPPGGAAGADALRLMGLGYISSSLGVVMARGLDATGVLVPTGVANLLTLWGIQLPVAVVLSHLLGVTGVWLGLAVGAVANGLLMSYRFRRSRWSQGG